MKNDEKENGSAFKGLSAKELLQKLKTDLSSHSETENAGTDDFFSDMESEAQEEVSETDAAEETAAVSSRRVYHVRRMSREEWEASKEVVATDSDADTEGKQTPQEELLDIEALMKKYMPEDDAKKFSKPLTFHLPEADEKNEEEDKEDELEEAEELERELFPEIDENDPDSVEPDEEEEETLAEDASLDADEAFVEEVLSETEEEPLPDEGFDGENSMEEEASETGSGEYDPSEEFDPDEVMPEEEPASEEAFAGEAEAEGEGETGSEEEKPEDLDETDLNLMIAFGMEDELAKTVGQEKADEIAADADKKSEKYEKKEDKTEEPLANEYTSPAQNKAFFKAYKKQYQSCLIRLFLCAALLILTFFYENIGLFHATLPGALNPVSYPVVYIMIDLQLLVLGAALVWRQILDGALALIRLKPIPESVHAVLLFCTLLYHIALCFFPVGAALRLFNFPMMLCLLMALIHELLNLRREILTFNVIAAKRLKYALDRLDPDKAPLETEAFYDVLPDRPSIFKITKSSFVDDFKRRMGGYSHNKVALSAIIPLSVLIAAVLLILSLYRTGSISDALTSAYTALVLAMPFAVFLTYSLPFYKASRVAFETESAIIGDTALDEYASASSVSFDDRDVFPSYGVKVKSVKVFGASRIDEIIYFAASVFNLAGGPLRDVFDVATMDLGHSENVELLSISADGLEALVDGEQIVFCKESYLLANGYSVSEDPEDEEVEQNGEISIMYFIRGGEVSAKLYVQYHLDPDFDFILKKLYKAGICVGIKTLDPNIDDEMLAKRINLERYPLRVLKCREIRQTPDRSEHVSSGIVSRHSPKALLQAFALCDKVQYITKTNLIINVFAVVISVLISTFIVLFGLSGGVYSLYVALYQVFWMIPLLVMTRVFL